MVVKCKAILYTLKYWTALQVFLQDWTLLVYLCKGYFISTIKNTVRLKANIVKNISEPFKILNCTSENVLCIEMFSAPNLSKCALVFRTHRTKN